MDTPLKWQRPLQEVLEMQIQGNDVVIEGRLLKSVRLEHEWHDDVQDPETFRMALRQGNVTCRSVHLLAAISQLETEIQLHGRMGGPCCPARQEF